jgi:alpha-D-xyloside xylohydrolase
MRTWALVAACALAGTSSAEAAKVDSVRQVTTGLELHTADGVLVLEPWSDSIVHVRFGPPNYSGNYNPAVIATPQKAPFSVRETGDAYLLSTARLRLRIDKATSSVSFQDSSGATLLEEAERSIGNGIVAAFRASPHIYGLGGHQNGLLDYNGNSVHLQQKNGDVGVPFLLSPTGFGILWNNASVMDVDVGKPGAKFPLVIRNEGGRGIDYDFILGPEPDQVIAGYRSLTGDVPLMPRWSWGFWQSREHYETGDQELGVARTYRAMGIPIDAIVTDWQHWRPGEWGAMKFDPARWPDPKAFVEELHAMHVHLPVSIWARFDPGTDNAKTLDAMGGLFAPTFRNVYPSGFGRWYDAWNPKARALYGKMISASYAAQGFDAWWLDASEPELGGNWGELRDLPTAAGPGRDVFNSYPLLHTTAVYEAVRRAVPEKRPVILTRSAYAGQQRNGAITWSGDTQGNWEVFRQQIPAALNFSMSGIPYWSADIGGFFGGDTHDPKYAELFTRWEQFAVFTPQFRIHGTNGGKEIWNWNGDAQPRLIENIKLRYRLLPYLYSLSWDVAAKRGTFMRALAFDFRTDPKALAVTDEYLFGRALLVAPVIHEGATSRSVYLPGRHPWYDFWTGKRSGGGQTIEAAAPIDRIPVYARAGAIVPFGPVKPYADAASDEPTEIRVYPGADGSFTLYDDAGEGFGYERGEYSAIRLTWNDRKHALSIAARDGTYASNARLRVVCGSAPQLTRDINYTGHALQVPLAECR